MNIFRLTSMISASIFYLVPIVLDGNAYLPYQVQQAFDNKSPTQLVLFA